MLVLSRLDALARRLLPGLFLERTKSGAPISVSHNGTTSVDIHTVWRLAVLKETTQSIPWTPCAVRNPGTAGTYLCYEPNIGPPPDIQFLRWDTDRGWRDDNDNKGFPTHWVRLEIPHVAHASDSELPYYRGDKFK
jgi:hypothetical protein